jgi:acetyl esterase/lipase
MLPPEIFLSTGSADFLGLATLQFATLLRKLQIRFELHLLEGAGHDAIRYPQLDASRELLALFTDFGHKACGTAPRV